MSRTLHDRTIALSAVLQSALIVDHYARLGHSGCQQNELLLSSLFEFSPPDVQAIYGGVQNLQPGLRLLLQAMNQPKDLDVIRYAIALLKLAKKLEKNDAYLMMIGKTLEEAQSKLHYFDHDYEQITVNVADLYVQTISKLSPRVVVKGEESLLRQESMAVKIRTHLMCGIRAALLWRQCGGNQWELIFKRKSIAEQASQMLNTGH